MKQKRYVSANGKKTFADSEAFFSYMADRLAGYCECDGRGCTICIAADAFNEAIALCKLRNK